MFLPNRLQCPYFRRRHFAPFLFTVMLAALIASPQAASAQQAEQTEKPVAAQPPQKAQTLDLSTPEAALKSAFDAILRGEIKTFARVVFGANPDNPTLKEFRSLVEPPPGEIPPYSAVLVNKKTEGDEVTATYRIQPPEAEKGEEFTGLVRFRRDGESWKILPPDPQKMLTIKPADAEDLLLVMTMIVAYPEVVLAARQRAREATCQENLQQLALAARRYASIHSGRLSLTSENWRERLKSSVPGQEVFTCGEKHDSNSYAFNNKLSGVALSRIRRPEQVVLLYEADDGKLAFRHGGRAAVAFTDGHVALITPAQANNLLWIP